MGAYNKPSSSTVTKISTSDFFGGLKTKKRKTPKDITKVSKDVTKVVTPKKKRSLESTDVVQQPNKKQKVVDLPGNLTGPSTKQVKSTKHDSDDDFIIDEEEQFVEKKK